MYNYKELLDSVQKTIAEECPPATQDISLNLANRKICVDKAKYGPANPQLDNNDFWQQKADLFNTSIEQAKTMRCSNCAAFIVKEKMIKCIEKGICEEDMNEAGKIVDLANLGYCELFDFKCAGDRTCDAWITGGPLKDTEDEDTEEEESESGSRPGLWDNIRKKKERMGKNYKPAKPGDKDRPDTEQWKKLTK